MIPNYNDKWQTIICNNHCLFYRVMYASIGSIMDTEAWLFTSPDYQQQWCQPCSLGVNENNLSASRNYSKCKYNFMFPFLHMNSAHNGLTLDPIYILFETYQHQLTNIRLTNIRTISPRPCILLENPQWLNVSRLHRTCHDIRPWSALCCVLLWCIIYQFYPYSSRLLHWHWENRTAAPISVTKRCSIWVNISHAFTLKPL